MADDSSDETPEWPAAQFARQFREAGEQAMQGQQEMFRQMLGGASGFEGFSGLNAMSMGTATFKTRVQSGGRISIPDAEREALDIEEGDIVQAIVIPIKRNHSESE
ncbi:MAG: AbrB/MazE/SpoVT family DNA-binding domain-containing protein [Halobacteriaceae archaeon]